MMPAYISSCTNIVLLGNCRHETPVLSKPIEVIHLSEDLVVLDKPCSLPVSCNNHLTLAIHIGLESFFNKVTFNFFSIFFYIKVPSQIKTYCEINICGLSKKILSQGAITATAKNTASFALTEISTV